MTSRNPKDFWTGIIYIAVRIWLRSLSPATTAWALRARWVRLIFPAILSVTADRDRHHFPGPLVSQAGYSGRQVRVQGAPAGHRRDARVRSYRPRRRPDHRDARSWSSSAPMRAASSDGGHSTRHGSGLTVFCILIFLKGSGNAASHPGLMVRR